jgi:phosphoglycerate dehydrogenase-like enzyme
MKRRAAFFYDYPIDREGDVFGGGRREKVAALLDLHPHVVNARSFAEHAPALADVEVIVATWGLPAFTDAHFAAMPKLRAVFYAAGNVRAFATPLVERDVVLVSAWAINAIATAQLVLSQILLTCRGYFRGVRRYAELRDPATARAFRRTGAEGATIGLIGMGWIARRLTKHLHELGFRVIAYDPFLTPAAAGELGVEKVELDDVFARAAIVSNHVPDLPETRGMLGAAHFERLREGATFINSGRGAQIVEADLARVLAARPDLTALLDVTFPEPPTADSPLWSLPNVVMSPHVGGTIGDEVVRLADCAIEELESWLAGRPLRYQVTREVLATMG